jgi:uncharacterized membrane-anchored protein
MIGNFEYIKWTAKTVFIEAQGYDPTDLFRGDYVHLAYRLPITASQETMINDLPYKATMYVIPKIEDDIIVGIEDIAQTIPK